MILKFINADQKNCMKKIKLILNKRKINSDSNLQIVKKILLDVKKNKDKALFKYEKKFSKLRKIDKKDIVFSKSELNFILKKLN